MIPAWTSCVDELTVAEVGPVQILDSRIVNQLRRRTRQSFGALDKGLRRR